MDNFSSSLPPLRSMLAFEAAARTGSFTKAADELHISQPAVSRQVRALEEALGVPLFVREHRGVTLTEPGRIYSEAIASGFKLILDTGSVIMQSEPSTRITIYANYGLASYWLMPRLSQFKDAFPDVDIVVQTVEEEQKLSDTEQEIAIRFGAGSWADGTSRLLFHETGFPVCSPAYLDKSGPLTSLEDISGHRLLHLSSQSQPWLGWKFFMKHFGIDCKLAPSSSYNNYTLAIQAALAGEGIAIGWNQVAGDFLERGWLVKPIKEQVTTAFGYYCVVNDNVQAQASAPLNQVLDWLDEGFDNLA